mmetsp:Transcript_19692/g.39919  ORF Transcript_19692/g.39919 Transcript_19692/m.39919 type:complete len:162 (+) Transcript_19692:495-980(+)
MTGSGPNLGPVSAMASNMGVIDPVGPHQSGAERPSWGASTLGLRGSGRGGEGRSVVRGLKARRRKGDSGDGVGGDAVRWRVAALFPDTDNLLAPSTAGKMPAERSIMQLHPSGGGGGAEPFWGRNGAGAYHWYSDKYALEVAPSPRRSHVGSHCLSFSDPR